MAAERVDGSFDPAGGDEGFWHEQEIIKRVPAYSSRADLRTGGNPYALANPCAIVARTRSPRWA